MVTTNGNGNGVGTATTAAGNSTATAITEVRGGQSLGNLSIYERIADPLAAAKFLGEAISQSGLFNLTNPKQGVIFAWECLVRRQPPLMLKETYHIIQGSLSMRAEKMLSNFLEAGGKHRQLSRTGDLASIELTMGAEKQVFSLSWDEAKGEPFVYSGKEKEVVPLILAGKFDKLKVKDKYATPRARSQMMWARVVSDGVRAMLPTAICGCYTPEEIGDFNDGGVAIPSNTGTVAAGEGQPGEVIDGEFQIVGDTGPATEGTTDDDSPTLAAQTRDTEADELNEALQAIDDAKTAAECEAAFSRHSSTVAADKMPALDAAFQWKLGTFKPGSNATTDDVAYCSAEQSKRLKDLYAQCGLTAEQIEKALAKRGVQSNRSLTAEAAAAFIAVLEGKLAQLQAAQSQDAAEVAGVSEKAPNEESAEMNGPATIEQVDEARRSLKEFGQVDPGQFNRYVAHMKAGGIKASDLTRRECQVLIDGIHEKTLTAFFDLSLANWKGERPPF